MSLLSLVSISAYVAATIFTLVRILRDDVVTMHSRSWGSLILVVLVSTTLSLLWPITWVAAQLSDDDKYPL